MNLFANSLWIFGLAIALAGLSYVSWQASFTRVKLRQYMGQPVMQVVFNLAGIFFCAGLATTSLRWWEIILWGCLGLAFFVQMIHSWQLKRQKIS